MSKTTELEKDVRTEEKETSEISTDQGEKTEIPSWSELLSRSEKPSVKKSSLGYLGLSAALFTGSMFLLPFTVGFSVSILLVSLLSGLIGKHDAIGAGVAGAVGGGASSVLTAGLAAITLTPVVGGVFTGLLAGTLGVFAGRWVKNKVRS